MATPSAATEPMNGAQLGECMAILGWDGRHLARALGRDEKMVRRWLDPHIPANIPPEAAAWIRRLAAYRRRNPPPVMQRTRGAGPRRAAALAE